ncbi:AAA family ATPase [Exiguobacterium sp. s146]|uniref:AAA family ATPase n=1 Tax=Exiguobacterium sp. s146 TaxID=2751223 RepID=UPI001BEA0850|nr:AAA family ATPase [Exiguobacterium sp. s146]
MIIWINGAFGSGKTTAAKQLQQRLTNAYLYDPEQAGFFIRDNLPNNMQLPDFQQHPEWRAFNVEMLKKITRSYDGVVVVPMTIVDRTYYDEMIGTLRHDGIRVDHYILHANKNTLNKRLNRRFEWFNSWGKAQIDRCLRAFQHDITHDKIETDHLTVEQVVEEIAKRSGLTLKATKRRSVLRSF